MIKFSPVEKIQTFKLKNPISIFLISTILSVGILKLGIKISYIFIILFFIIYIPEFYIILFLLVRPTLDFYSDYKPIFNLNVASLSTLMFILCSISFLLTSRELRIDKKIVFLSKINKLLLCFLCFSFLSAFKAQNFLEAITNWLRFVSVFLIFNYAILRGYSHYKGIKGLLLILCSAIIPLSLGFSQVLHRSGNQFTFGYNRIFGSFSHPNMYSIFLAVLFLYILFYIQRPVKSGLKKLLVFALLMIIFQLYHTYTRTSWIAIFVSALFFIFGGRYTGNKAIFVYFAFFTLIVFFPQIQQRFLYTSSSSSNLLQWRLENWKNATAELMNHPFFGNGLGMFSEKYRYEAHNDYLRLFYETGLLGLFSYLAALLTIFFNSLKSFFIDKYNTENRLVCSLIIFLLIVSLTDNLLRATGNLIFILFLIGIFIGHDKK